MASQCNVQYLSNIGSVNISVANPYLDGTGTLGTVIIAGNIGGNSTVINSILIKAIGSTSEGMIRLFIYSASSSTTLLWREIRVPGSTQTGVVPAFSYSFNANLTLALGHRLLASTQNAEKFNIIAQAVDWVQCECPNVN